MHAYLYANKNGLINGQIDEWNGLGGMEIIIKLEEWKGFSLLNPMNQWME